jgi:hypothetical protein
MAPDRGTCIGNACALTFSVSLPSQNVAIVSTVSLFPDFSRQNVPSISGHFPVNLRIL